MASVADAFKDDLEEIRKVSILPMFSVIRSHINRDGRNPT